MKFLRERLIRIYESTLKRMVRELSPNSKATRMALDALNKGARLKRKGKYEESIEEKNCNQGEEDDDGSEEGTEG